MTTKGNKLLQFQTILQGGVGRGLCKRRVMKIIDFESRANSLLPFKHFIHNFLQTKYQRLCDAKKFLLFQICSRGKQALCVNWESKNKQTDAKIVNCENHKCNITVLSVSVAPCLLNMSTDVQTQTESITLRHIHNLGPV